MNIRDNRCVQPNMNSLRKSMHIQVVHIQLFNDAFRDKFKVDFFYLIDKVNYFRDKTSNRYSDGPKFTS